MSGSFLLSRSYKFQFIELFTKCANPICHCEPVRTLVWQSPKVPENLGGFPRQFENWLGMTGCL